MNLRRPEDYSCLTPVLQDVNRTVIALDARTKKVAVRRAMIVVHHIVSLLSDGDETFRGVFNGIRHVGSYYDGLRVTAPTEFDINVVLKFPFHKICKVQRCTSVPGFVLVCVKGDDKPSWSLFSPRHTMDWRLATIVDDSGYIRRDKVLQWWQSMFARLVSQHLCLNVEGELHQVKWKTSGPAITVNITPHNSDLSIDIDLVPVLMFQDGDAMSPSPVYQSWIKENGYPKEWYIVPKPLNASYGNTNRLWRLSFTDQEKVIMNRLYHLKPTNRLMKRLRDNFGWKNLSSYFIKNMFITEAYKKRSSGDEAFFTNNLGYLFVYFLSLLKIQLQRGWLPFFWDHRMNLFHKIETPHTSGNWCNRLDKIVNDIHRLIDQRDMLKTNEYIRSLLMPKPTIWCTRNIKYLFLILIVALLIGLKSELEELKRNPYAPTPKLDGFVLICFLLSVLLIFYLFIHACFIVITTFIRFCIELIYYTLGVAMVMFSIGILLAAVQYQNRGDHHSGKSWKT